MTPHERPLPPGVEAQLSRSNEVAGTAIAAAEAHRELQALAEDQAALRKLAELVAHGAPLDEVFTAVTTTASTLLDRSATLTRHVDGCTSLVVAACPGLGPGGLRVPAGVDRANGTVPATGPVIGGDGTDRAAVADRSENPASSTVPVVVEGRVWGTLGSTGSGPPLAAGTQERLTHFAELAAAAIANAENKAKLTASRARVIAAADETRRRMQRDVHDSAQQRLVHTIISLQLAMGALDSGGEVRPLIAEALRNAQQASRDIRDIVRGILPAALTRGGLAAGLATLVDDLALPVRLDVTVPRLPKEVETTAYFVVAEALTNVVKHARANRADVWAEVAADGKLVLEVRDDGCGGADPLGGSGLTGLADRVEAGNGTMTLFSPDGTGTIVHIELPA